jgi:hypothetical protein
LCSGGLGLNAGNPVGRVARTGLDQSCDHPGEGFGVAGIVPRTFLKVVEGGVVEFGCVSDCVFLRHNREVYNSGTHSYFLSGPQAWNLKHRPSPARENRDVLERCPGDVLKGFVGEERLMSGDQNVRKS